MAGMYTDQRLNPLQTRKGLRKKAKVSNRTREIWPSVIIGGFGKRKPWWDCEPVLQSKEQERKPLTYSGARPISIPVGQVIAVELGPTGLYPGRSPTVQRKAAAFAR